VIGEGYKVPWATETALQQLLSPGTDLFQEVLDDISF
jgi:hypothetical protein